MPLNYKVVPSFFTRIQCEIDDSSTATFITWWNNQTLGTRIYTFLKGKKVGIDEKGNKFYVHRKNNKKRWIIYNGLMDASKVPALWHDWLHYRTDEIPNESEKNLNWYKMHK